MVRSDVFVTHFATEDSYGVTIEADGKSVYGYFMKGEQITGDVWLFNLETGPADLPWKGAGEPPYMNASVCAHDFDAPGPIAPDDFRVVLNRKSDPISAAIYFRDKLLGIVYDGKSPGKSRFAKADSPVAKRMENPNGPFGGQAA